jgi:hypothetical protein
LFRHRFWEIAAARINGARPHFVRKRKSLLMDRTTEKVACPLFLRVFLNGVSYAAAEKSEWRMALKI